jgi:putative transferase (TIGR04331 family)
MVFELLPVCYLEDFEKLTKEVQKLPWPNRPKFIFTSNAFDTDEVFKLWAATKVESGSKYVVGQHGNNYSTHRYLNPTVEEVTTDKFLTWGWTDGLEQHTPAFLFKSAGGKAAARNPTGGLLLIEVCIDHRITTWDSTAEFGDYFKDQQTFIRRLDDAPKKHLTVRLHAGYRNQRWSEEARWQAFDPLLKIDTGEAAISRILAKSRLVVYSYDSTGILETLSQNIPTLAFWPNGFEHLRESAKPYYQFLVDAGIVHLTPDSAAQKINEVWDDVEDWWAQRAVQEACVLFCNRFARKELKRIQKLRIILHDEPSRCGIIK